jgi:hypothetical protein
MLWSLNFIATKMLAWNFVISRNDWINVVSCYGLSLPLFWNSALILLLYFIFNIVLYDGMNHPSLCIFFFLWCYLACEHLDARTPQKRHSWRVHNCVKFESIVLLFCLGRRLRIKVCKVSIHTRISIHYESLGVNNTMSAYRAIVFCWFLNFLNAKALYHSFTFSGMYEPDG